MSKTLVSTGVRNAIEEFIPDVEARAIHAAWMSAEFPRYEGSCPTNGVRRHLFRAYCGCVDWTDRGQVTRAFRAFRDLIDAGLFTANPTPEFPGGESEREELLRRLHGAVDDCGLTIDDQYLLHLPTVAVLSEVVWSGIENPDVIHEHLERLRRSIDQEDTAQVIGSAKELIESTAKIVLTRTGVEFDTNPQFHQLINQVHTSLRLNQQRIGVHQDQDYPEAKAIKGINRVLGGAKSIALGIDEYRNAVGTGHGREKTAPGMGLRHAQLAVDAATLWCNLILATLGDQTAPWKSGGSED